MKHSNLNFIQEFSSPWIHYSVLNIPREVCILLINFWPIVDEFSEWMKDYLFMLLQTGAIMDLMCCPKMANTIQWDSQ